MLIATDIQRSLAGQQPGVSVWKSLRHAVVATWGEAKLKEKSERLKAIRNQLQFHVIVSIKAKVDLLDLRDSTRIKALDESTQRLIHAILIDQKATQRELNSHTETLNQKLREARWQSDRQHQETQSLLIHHHREQMDAIQNISSQSVHIDKSTDASKVIKEILDALWFSRMVDRFDDIKPAHFQTFEWIYSGEKDNGSSSCTFMKWMEGENGVFWVSGRAGSGKSTLMKYLAADDRTNKAFKTWSGDRILVTAHYWFWDQAQNSLQKSLDGFLRAIMHNIIQQCRDYAELLFPDRFVVGRDWTDFPTFHELKRAFKRLVGADNPPACVALMIDGLDEYEAPEEQQYELARVLKDAAKARHLKIVVSSRPETAFETTFVDCEKLRLHELTRADRTVYVTDHLYRHKRFDFLVKQARNGEKQKEELVKYAVEGSEGIFLWLRLVVATLMEDVNTCATLAELRAILDQFPHGLEELFRHMLRRIPERRRIKGLQLVQLLHCAVAVSKRSVSNSSAVAPPMSALMLSKAHSDYRRIITRRWKLLSPMEHNDIVQRIDHLLRSHCAGLLELKYCMPEVRAANETQDEQTRRLLEDPEVAFLHRSVVEFLERSETQSELLPMVMSANSFDPYVSLMSCLLYKIKTHPLSHSHWPYKWSLVLRIMHAAVFAETVDLNATKGLLENLDRTMAQTFLENEQVPSNMEARTKKRVSKWARHCPWEGANFHSAREYRDLELPRGDSMLSFAIENGLARFPLDNLCQLEACENNVQAASLLVSACRASTLQSMKTGGIRPAVILQLLRLGANPNYYFEHQLANGRILSTTPWLEMLRTVGQSRLTGIRGFKQLFEVLMAFLGNGADPEARIRRKRGGDISDTSIHTAKDLIQQYFSCTPDYRLISFVPFEEVWEACSPLRRLPVTRYPQFYVPEILGLQAQIGNHNSLSPSDIKQIMKWKKTLIKLLKRPEVPAWRGRRRKVSIFHKLICHCSVPQQDESTEEDSEAS